MSDDLWLEYLAERTAGIGSDRAPASLKSRVYSAVVERMAQSGPLLPLVETRDSGGRLCVFEHVVAALPAGTAVQSRNPCRICHARVLGERMDHAPIFWPGCPYSEFHNG